jgi:hypothetical protein
MHFSQRDGQNEQAIDSRSGGQPTLLSLRQAGSFPLERQTPVKEHSSMKRGGEVEHRRTGWSRFDAKTPEQIEADIRDPDTAPAVDADWFAWQTSLRPR